MILDFPAPATSSIQIQYHAVIISIIGAVIMRSSFGHDAVIISIMSVAIAQIVLVSNIPAVPRTDIVS